MHIQKWFKRCQAWAGMAAVVVMTGCGSCGTGGDGDNECEVTADCQEGQVCDAQNECVVDPAGRTCTRDLECDPADEYCAAGRCALKACEDDSGCAEGAICEAGSCRAGCRDNDGCQEGQTCNSSRVCITAGCMALNCAAQFETCEGTGEAARCVRTDYCENDIHCALYGSSLEDDKEYICDTNQRKCVEKPACVSDGDCLIGEICEDRSDQNERNRCRDGCRDCPVDNPGCDPSTNTPEFNTRYNCPSGEFCDVDGSFTQPGDEYDSFVCTRGCTSEADCNTILNDPNGDYACIDLICIEKCEVVDDCAAGQICTGQPQICQGCSENDDCPATQDCDFTQGYSEQDIANPELGLCVNKPPACPPDGYGKNQSLAQAYRIETFPFVADGTMPDIQQPYFCQENNLQGEWFVVAATPGKVITVSLTYQAMGANLDVALLNSLGSPLVAADRPPTIDQGMESLTYGVANGSDFYIHVRGGIGLPKIPYTLIVDVADPPPCVDDVFEENDTEATAAALPEDVDHEALQVCGLDRDFYQIEVASNQVVRVETVAPVRAGEVDIFVTTLAGGAVEQEETVSEDKTTVFFATETMPETFIVEVVVASGVGNVDYDLRWSQRDNECADVFDAGTGNNTCATASPLPLTEVPDTDPQVRSYTNTEELRVCGDEDWYAIDLLPLQTLSVVATYNASQAAGQIDLRLRGPGLNDCNTIVAFDVRETDPVDTNIRRQKLEYTAVNGGTFYLTSTIDLGLNVPYDLKVEIEDGPSCPDDQFEDNDDLASATVIDRAEALLGNENAYVGLRYCDLDQDFYSIELEVGDKIRWIVDHDASQGADLDATIYLPDGSNPVSSTSTSDDEEIEFTAMVAGTYTLGVYAKGAIRTDYRLLTYITPAGGMEVGPLDPACPDMFENNDTFAEAASVDEGVYNLLVCGQMPTDEDWYSTTLQPGETLTVRLDFIHANGNINLFLYNDMSSTIAIDDSRTVGDFEEVTYTAAREQTLYYKVTLRSVPSNAYQMTVSIDPAAACVDDDSEDNDSASSATSVDSTSFLDRRIKCEDDEDWYVFEVTENQKAEVYVNHRSDADVDLFVYSDASGTTLLDSAVGTSSGSESLVFTAPDDPTTSASATQTVYTYRVKVETKTRARLTYDLLFFRDLNNDGSFGPNEGSPDRNCPDRYENNDTRTQATPLAAGLYDDIRLCQYGGGSNDADYYSVFVPNGATLDVDLLFSHDEGNLDMALLRPNGSQEGRSGSADDNESLTYVNNTGAGVNYVIHVYGVGIGFETYYDLELSLVFGGMCNDDNVGLNGPSAPAMAIGTGNYSDLTLCENTSDWFKLNLSANERVLAELELNNALGNIDIELTDATGNVVFATSASDTNRETLDYTVSSAGTYYLRVFSRLGVLLRNDYDLWLSLGGAMPSQPFCPDVYERNDSLTSPSPLSINTQNFYGDMIACGDDDDWYLISGVLTGMYRAILFFDADSGSQLDIEVYDDQGMTLITSGTASGNDETVSFSASAGSSYLLKVSNEASNADETPYALYLNRANAPCPEDTYEQNDTPAQGTTKLLTESRRYVLGSCDDDYFTIVPTNSGPMTITISHDQANLDLLVRATRGVTLNNANTSVPGRKTITFPAVTAGEQIELYVGVITGSGPYLLDISN